MSLTAGFAVLYIIPMLAAGSVLVMHHYFNKWVYKPDIKGDLE